MEDAINMDEDLAVGKPKARTSTVIYEIFRQIGQSKQDQTV